MNLYCRSALRHVDAKILPDTYRMSGRTLNGVDASGGIVIVYFTDELGPIFLVGQETTYLTHYKDIDKFISSDGEDIFNAFLSPGSITNKIALSEAKQKFTNVCKELEIFYKKSLTHVTFSDIKNSERESGYISGKPRYVAKQEYKTSKFAFKKHHAERFGFPKGGYISGSHYVKKSNNVMNIEDFSINDTIVRECYEETSIKLDKTKLKDMNKTFLSGNKSNYALFTYELSKFEFESINAMNLLSLKNSDYENELHNIQFLRIPNKDNKGFFINAISRQVYEYFISTKSNVKGGRKKRYTRKNVVV